jgi:hypothetical protein
VLAINLHGIEASTNRFSSTCWRAEDIGCMGEIIAWHLGPFLVSMSFMLAVRSVPYGLLTLCVRGSLCFRTAVNLNLVAFDGRFSFVNVSKSG